MRYWRSKKGHHSVSEVRGQSAPKIKTHFADVAKIFVELCHDQLGLMAFSVGGKISDVRE